MTELLVGGASLGFPMAGNWGTVIESRESKRFGPVMLGNTLAYLFLNRNGGLSTIKSITIDPIAATVDMDSYVKLSNERRQGEIPIAPVPNVSGSWGFYAVEAPDMVELIDRALKGEQLAAGRRKALEEVAVKIDDDSNPILIIGKIK